MKSQGTIIGLDHLGSIIICQTAKLINWNCLKATGRLVLSEVISSTISITLQRIISVNVCLSVCLHKVISFSGLNLLTGFSNCTVLLCFH